MHSRTLTRIALSLCLPVALAACGAELDAPETSQISSAQSTAPTFLVSFASGTSAANQASIIKAAGGAVATTYTNIGIVLASSTDPAFVSKMRANASVFAVAPSHTVASGIQLSRKSGAFSSAAEVLHSGTPPAAHPTILRAPGADPLSNRQWDMDQIHSPQARAVNAGKSSVLVGVLDSGIDVSQPDLAGQVVSSASASCVGGIPNTDPAVWSNDVIGHGTFVSGIIAAKKNNVGVVGVAPGVKLAAVKVASDDFNDPNFGLIFADAFVCAIEWSVAHGVDVMNASLTIDPMTGPVDDLFCTDEPDRFAEVTIVRQAIIAAAKKNATLVAATGNSFLDLANISGATQGSTCKMIPVQLPTVIGVSAVGYAQQLAFYSNYGAKVVDLTGPGGDFLVPNPVIADGTASNQILSVGAPNSLFYGWAAGWNGQIEDCSSGTCSTYVYLQGTSAAAPHVTGVAALAISRYGKMGPLALRGILSATATKLPCPPAGYDPGGSGTPATCSTTIGTLNNFYGAGEIDALKVVK
jgi:subtilisin family serine protease